MAIEVEGKFVGLLGFLKRDKNKDFSAVIDVSDSDFQQQVIRKSYKKSIIVDYWASWCGPCRQLGPILEKIAVEPESNILLAKLDTEHNRKTASRYQIRSIPHVKAFKNGQVVDEFTGALPETLVRRFVTKVVDTPAPPARIKGSPNPQKRVQQAEQHLMRGRGFEAFVLLKEFPASPQEDRANQLLPLARFIVDMDDGDGLTGLDGLDTEYAAAADALHKRKPAAALEHLDRAVDSGEEIDKSYTNNVITSLLDLLGKDHPISKNHLITREGAD